MLFWGGGGKLRVISLKTAFRSAGVGIEREAGERVVVERKGGVGGGGGGRSGGVMARGEG